MGGGRGDVRFGTCFSARDVEAFQSINFVSGFVKKQTTSTTTHSFFGTGLSNKEREQKKKTKRMVSRLKPLDAAQSLDARS